MSIFFWLLLVIALIVWATVRLNLHPFLALLTGAIAMGFITGLEAPVLIGTISDGFGSTLRSIGIVIAAGAIIGEYLERSGGAKVLANRILEKTGEKNAPLAMSLTGYIVSVPVFCDSGFIVLSALNKAISRRTGISLAVLAVALASGLYATHVFVPPTPGPLAAAATQRAEIGLVLIYGLIVSVPAVLLVLIWAARYLKNIELDFEDDDELTVPANPPSFTVAIAPILVPILLIALKSVAEYPTLPFGEGLIFQALVFIGNPVIALLVGVCLAFLMVRRGKEGRVRQDWLEEGLRKAGVIILITGVGGAFGGVLRETDLGDYAAQFVEVGSFGVLIPFLIAAFLKSAQGSSTVAIITAAAICAPLLEPLGYASPSGSALIVLAIGAGSMTVSHVNDSYFWVVAKFSHMDTQTALKTHTVATLIMGLTGLVTVQIMAWLLV